LDETVGSKPVIARRHPTTLFILLKNRSTIWDRQVWVMNQAFLMTSRAFEQQAGRPKPSEGGGMREAPPHVSYDMLCLSSSQEID
jgi:hypothetical protein